MLIHRHRQYRTVGRVISWVARWLSLALIVVLLAPMLVRAGLSCDRQLSTMPLDVARQICRDEIQFLRNRSAKAAELIAELERDSHTHEVVIIPEGESMTIALNTEGAHFAGEFILIDGLVLRGTGEGSDTLILWNPYDTSPYLGDGVPRDPDSGLVHEFGHAVLAAKGQGSTATFPDTNVKRDEIDVTQEENEHRQEVGLRLRTKYGVVDVPPPTPPPVVKPPVVKPPVVKPPVQPPPALIVCYCDCVISGRTDRRVRIGLRTINDCSNTTGTCTATEEGFELTGSLSSCSAIP